MWCHKALAFFAMLELGLLVAVQSCGHHVVHRQVKDLAERHVAQQLHMISTPWSMRTRPHGGERGRDVFNDESASSLEVTRTGEHAHIDDDTSTGGLVHNENDTDQEVSSVSEEAAMVDSSSRGRSLQQASIPSPAPIRLSVTYQRLDALDTSHRQMLTRVVEAVRRVFQKFVKVKYPSRGGMLVDPSCNISTWACYPNFNTLSQDADRECGLATILREHVVNPFNCTTFTTNAQRMALGRGSSGPASGVGGGASGYGTGCSSYAGTKGDETDMYLYITAVQNDDCELGAAAWAKPCLLDVGNNRPLMGAANVCPAALAVLDEEQLTAVLTHEMIHALGFTDAMYNLTRRADGTLRPLGELVQNSTVGGRPVKVLISPNVREAARAQFGCPRLLGAQLEEEGSAGSAGSHWEYTHYQGEVMVASTIFAADGTPPALSNLTLSYLDDTGWYVTNRSAAGLLSWGAGAGCQLPNSSCSEYMINVPEQRLFCDPTVVVSSSSGPSLSCSSSYKSTGVCRALNFTGGCGLVLSRGAKETCLGPGASNDEPDVFGWGIGTPSGRCLPVVYRFQVLVGYNRYTYPGNGQDGDTNAACFDTVCSADGSKVYVRMFGENFECPTGQDLNLARLLPSRYTLGHIGPCPSARDLCATQSCPASRCNPSGGECLDGVCYCRLQYTGEDCSFNLISGQAMGDIGSDDSPGSGNSSASGTPTPPLQSWILVVQLTLSLNNSVNDVKARQADLRTAIADWAGLRDSEVEVVAIAPATRDSVGSSNGTNPGDSFDATAAAGQRRRGLQQAASPPPPSSQSAPVSVATALIKPSVPQVASQLLLWLKSNETQRDRLTLRLLLEGFFVTPAGISYESFITQPMITSPAPESASTPPPASSNRSRAVMVIALVAAAVAVIGIIGAVITVLVLRSARSMRHGRRDHYYEPSAITRPDIGPFATLGGIPGGHGGHGGGPSPIYGTEGAGSDMGAVGGPQGLSSNPFAAREDEAWPSAPYGSMPETATLSYYSSRAASLASGQQPSGGRQQISPLFSGLKDRF